MTSVQDVYDQLVAANAVLVEVRDDSNMLISNAGQIIITEETLESTLTEGLVTLTADNQVLAGELHQVDTTLLHLCAQTDTVICSLEKIAQSLCDLVNASAVQTTLQTTIAHELRAIRDMYATANPTPALEWARAEQTNDRLDKCCPTAESEPPCKFSPCSSPTPLADEPANWQVPQFTPPRPPA